MIDNINPGDTVMWLGVKWVMIPHNPGMEKAYPGIITLELLEESGIPLVDRASGHTIGPWDRHQGEAWIPTEYVAAGTNKYWNVDRGNLIKFADLVGDVKTKSKLKNRKFLFPDIT